MKYYTLQKFKVDPEMKISIEKGYAKFEAELRKVIHKGSLRTISLNAAMKAMPSGDKFGFPYLKPGTKSKKDKNGHTIQVIDNRPQYLEEAKRLINVLRRNNYNLTAQDKLRNAFIIY